MFNLNIILSSRHLKYFSEYIYFNWKKLQSGSTMFFSSTRRSIFSDFEPTFQKVRKLHKFLSNTCEKKILLTFEVIWYFRNIFLCLETREKTTIAQSYNYSCISVFIVNGIFLKKLGRGSKFVANLLNSVSFYL